MNLMDANALDSPLPTALAALIHHLRSHGLDTEGIFRRSPSSTDLRLVKEALQRGETPDLSLYDIHVTAVLIKLFFRWVVRPLASP